MTAPVAALPIATLEDSVARAMAWVERHDYRAYEPADGNSSLLFPLTGGQVFPMRILQQVVLRAPFHIRPWIGVRAHESSIGRGYMAWGYLLMHRRRPSPELRSKAEACLQWLMVNRAAGYDEHCWGDPYDYATRNGRRPYGEPLLIWSALIGQMFLDAADILADDRYLDVAHSVGRWMQRLPSERTATGVCLSYNAYSQSSIHNSNAMGAAFLARLGATVGSQALQELAREAMLYTASRQLEDGSWWYAEAAKYHWVDNFHTGYNLSALQVYERASGDRSFHDGLVRGMAFFTKHFFEVDGRPRYFHNQLSPIDIQCASQAIDTLTALSDLSDECLPLATRVADWTVREMQAPDGHFYYRDLGWTKVRTPMLHWGQGTMIKAIASLLGTVAR
jgi:hypothetical protein